jgi:hypothetical protein
MVTWSSITVLDAASLDPFLEETALAHSIIQNSLSRVCIPVEFNGKLPFSKRLKRKEGTKICTANGCEKMC